MDTAADQVNLLPGMDVISLDNDKVGKIVALDDTQITVEKGLFFPKDYVIPMSAVESADDNAVYLNISKDDALNQRWSADTNANWDAATQAAETGTLVSTAPQVSANDTLTIPVHEEELTATKRKVDAGQVEINTRVVSEDRTLEVPITEERVRVTRRVVDRDATGSEAAFTGGSVNVPVSTEQVDMQKRVHVAEEIEVAKEAVQTTQQVTGTVRREVIDVADKTSVDVIDGTSGAAAKGSTR